MDLDAQTRAVAAAAQCTQEVRWRKHSLPGPSSSPVSACPSLHADGRAAKRSYPEAFPQEGDYVPQSPYDRRHTFPLATAGDNRYTQTDPPVPVHSSGAAPPVSYSPSLPYTSQLSTGFGSTPGLACFNIHHPHLDPFPGHPHHHQHHHHHHQHQQHHNLYDQSPLSHQHHPAVASSSGGSRGTASGGFMPLASPTSSYNNSVVAASSSTSFTHPHHHQQQSPSAVSPGAGGQQQQQQHQQQHPNAQVGSGDCNVVGAGMTRHEVPSGGEPVLSGPPHHPYSGGGGSSFHNSRTSSTTIMHHEERTGYHHLPPQQYYAGPYGAEAPLALSHQVPAEASPASGDAMGVEKEWDMIPDAEIAAATVAAAQNCLSPEPIEEMVLEDTGGGVGGSGSNNGGMDRRGKKSRGKFEQTKLNETNLTRRMKACVRCRIQRVRCENDPNDQNGTCKTCKDVSINSKKVIHRIPCLRVKLTEAVLYREGGLHLTRRWETNSLQLHNVGDWASSEVRTIELTLGICDEPIQLKVRKFVPREGDVVHRHWVDGTVKKKKELQPYALADVAATAKEFMAYVRAHCVEGLLRGVGNKQPLIRKTYEMAVKHYRDLLLMQESDAERRENPEIKFLFDLFWVVFAMRHTRGSSWICGSDKLDMEPETKDTSYPLFNKVSTPRMIIEQFDSINALKALQPVRSRLLAKLEEWVSSSKPTYWFTMYLAYFILLHEVSLTCEDRYRHAVANSAGIRYTIPRFVEDLQRGANVMLAHWQYYKADVDPLNLDIRAREKSQLNFLSAEQLMFIVQSYREAARLQEEFQLAWDMDFWEHPYFYVSQMFETSWTPRRCWTINYPGPAPNMDLTL